MMMQGLTNIKFIL